MVNPLSRSFSSLLEGNVSAVRCGGLGGFSHMKKGNIKRIFHPQKYHGTSQKRVVCGCFSFSVWGYFQVPCERVHTFLL